MHPVLGDRKFLLIYAAIWGTAALGQFSLLMYLVEGPAVSLAADAFFANLIFALLALGFWYTCRAFHPEEIPLTSILINHIGAAILVTMLWNGVVYALLQAVDPTYAIKVREGQFYSRILAGMLLYFLMIAVYYLIIYYRGYHEKLLRESELRGLVQEAELQALKFQINPHFLFNSLNSLNALILTRPDDASKMITRLADFLRSTLNAGESGERSLREELAAVHLYLDIEKVRFAEKLQVTEKIEEAALTVRVPAMILQPLFENAIKHGLQNSLAPVVITLSAGLEGEFLNIRLENTLEKRDKIVTPGSGVGLRNIEGRLRRLFPRHGQLVRITAAEDLFRVELFIPAGGGAP
ncbi:MAG TPA: histidine kinase [Calditrichia bacterium]|nr:histidine kinase [Calditrichota bacterium]HQV32713.1 histidine kinase [Calditrichia bacterium]